MCVHAPVQRNPLETLEDCVWMRNGEGGGYRRREVMRVHPPPHPSPGGCNPAESRIGSLKVPSLHKPSSFPPLGQFSVSQVMRQVGQAPHLPRSSKTRARESGGGYQCPPSYSPVSTVATLGKRRRDIAGQGIHTHIHFIQIVCTKMWSKS